MIGWLCGGGEGGLALTPRMQCYAEPVLSEMGDSVKVTLNDYFDIAIII